MSTTSAKFFVTHSFHDVEFARHLTEDLGKHGLDGFFDVYSVRPDDNIAERISQGLEACDVYVPVISRASLKSSWCREEINAAITLSNITERGGRPRIIPVLVEDCQNDLPVFLLSRLYINFAERYDEAIRELLEKGFGINMREADRMIWERGEQGQQEQQNQSATMQAKSARLGEEAGVRPKLKNSIRYMPQGIANEHYPPIKDYWQLQVAQFKDYWRLQVAPIKDYWHSLVRQHPRIAFGVLAIVDLGLVLSAFVLLTAFVWSVPGISDSINTVRESDISRSNVIGWTIVLIIEGVCWYYIYRITGILKRMRKS